MNTKTFHLLIVCICGLAILGALCVGQPWDYLYSAALSITVLLAMYAGSNREEFEVRVTSSIVVGVIALVATRALPFPWFKTAAWLGYSIAQAFLIFRILASRPYSPNFQNGFSLFLSVALGAFLGAIIFTSIAPWLGVSLGLYTFAFLFKGFRELGPKTHPNRNAQRIPQK